MLVLAYEDRFVEDYENGGNRFRQDYEPYERGGKTAEYPMERVLADQAEEALLRHSRCPSPRLTDNTVRQLAQAGGDVDVVKRVK